MLDVITCISEGDDPCGRRRQGVSRPDDGPAGRREGASLVPRLASPPAGCDREARVRAHDSTGEPGAGNRHAGFGERGEETCPRNSDCGPARKRRMSHRLPTGYAPPLDSTHGEALGSRCCVETSSTPSRLYRVRGHVTQVVGRRLVLCRKSPAAQTPSATGVGTPPSHGRSPGSRRGTREAAGSRQAAPGLPRDGHAADPRQ